MSRASQSGCLIIMYRTDPPPPSLISILMQPNNTQGLASGRVQHPPFAISLIWCRPRLASHFKYVVVGFLFPLNPPPLPCAVFSDTVLTLKTLGATMSIAHPEQSDEKAVQM